MELIFHGREEQLKRKPTNMSMSDNEKRKKDWKTSPHKEVWFFLMPTISSKDLASPKQCFPAFRGVFISMMKKLQNKCSCFPEPVKLSWKFEMKDNTNLGEKN